MSAVAVERATEFATDLIVKQLEPTIAVTVPGLPRSHELLPIHYFLRPNHCGRLPIDISWSSHA
jgi:hypothetical protein